MTDFEIFGQLGIEEGLSDDEIIEAWNVYSKKSTPNHPDTSILAQGIESKLNENSKNIIANLTPNEKAKLTFKKYEESRLGYELTDEQVEELRKKNYPDLEDYNQIIEVLKQQNKTQPNATLSQQKFYKTKGEEVLDKTTGYGKALLRGVFGAARQTVPKFSEQIQYWTVDRPANIEKKLYNNRSSMPSYAEKIVEYSEDQRRKHELFRSYIINGLDYVEENFLPNAASTDELPGGKLVEGVATELTVQGLAFLIPGKPQKKVTATKNFVKNVYNMVAGKGNKLRTGYLFGVNQVRLRGEAVDRFLEAGYDEDTANILADVYGVALMWGAAKIDQKALNLGKKTNLSKIFAKKIKSSDFKQYLSNITGVGILEGLQEGLEESILQSIENFMTGDDYNIDTILYNAAYGFLIGGITSGIWGTKTLSEKKKIRKDLEFSGINKDIIDEILIADDIETASKLLEGEIQRIATLDFNKIQKTTDDINPNEINIPSEFKAYTLEDIAAMNIGEDGRQLTNADLEVYANERIDPKVKSLFLNLMKNPNEENLKLYNEAVEKIYLKEEQRAMDEASKNDFDAGDIDEDVSILDEIKEETTEETTEETKPVEETTEEITEETTEETNIPKNIIKPRKNSKGELIGGEESNLRYKAEIGNTISVIGSDGIIREVKVTRTRPDGTVIKVEFNGKEYNQGFSVVFADQNVLDPNYRMTSTSSVTGVNQTTNPNDLNQLQLEQVRFKLEEFIRSQGVKLGTDDVNPEYSNEAAVIGALRDLQAVKQALGIGVKPKTKVKAEQVTEEQLKDLTDEDVEVLEEDLKIYEEDTNIEEETERIIEDASILGEGAELVVYKDMSDEDLVEYIGDLQIAEIPIEDFPDLLNELESRITSSTSLTLFKNAVESYVNKQKNEQTSRDVKDYIFSGGKTIKNMDLNEQASELYIQAMNHVQSAIKKKPNEYWLDQAQRWVDYVNRTPKYKYIKENWERNKITLQMIADSMKLEKPVQRRRELTKLLFEPVHDGNLDLVKSILKDENIDLYKTFGKTIIKSTKLFKESYTEKRVKTSPIVNNNETKQQPKNNPIPKAVVKNTDMILFTGEDYSLASRQEIQNFVNKTGLDENTAILLFGDAYDNNIKQMGTGIILDKSIPPSEETVEGTNFPISFSGATFVEKIIEDKKTIFIYRDLTGQLFSITFFDFMEEKTSVDLELIIDDLKSTSDTIRKNFYSTKPYLSDDDINFIKSEKGKKWFGENFKYYDVAYQNMDSLSPAQIKILANRIFEILQEKYGDFYIVDEDIYDSMTVKDLKKVAKKNNIKIPSNARKYDIQNLLRKNASSIYQFRVTNSTIHFNINIPLLGDFIKSFDEWSNKVPSYERVMKDYYKILSTELINYQSELGAQVDAINPHSISSIDAQNIKFENITTSFDEWSGWDISYMPSDQKAEEMFQQTLNNLQKIAPARTVAPLEMLNILNENIPTLLYLIKRGRITFAEVTPEQWESFKAPNAMALFAPAKFGKQIVLNPNGVFKTNEQKLQAFMHEMGHFVDFRFIRNRYGNNKARELQKKWDDYVDKLVKENPEIDKRLQFVTSAYESKNFQSEYFAEVFSYYMLGKMTTIQLEEEGVLPDIIPESIQLMQEILQEVNNLTEDRGTQTNEYVEPIPVSKYEFGNFQPAIDARNFNQGLPDIQELKFDNPPSVRQILEAADAIYTDYELKLNLENLNLTEKEMEISMLYLAQRQDVTYAGYDPVTEDQLPKQVRELLDGELGWDSISKDIDQELKIISEQLNLAYSSRGEFYFPLLWMHEGANTTATIEDLINQAAGITKSRKATTFEPVIKNPAEQLKKYLKNFSILKATANAIRSERADIRENIVPTAAAVVDAMSDPTIENTIDEEIDSNFIPDEDYIPTDFEEGTIIETVEETETEETKPQTFKVYRTKKGTATVKSRVANVLGDAEYYTFTEKDAAAYTQGNTENVESSEITVNNPYIVGESADRFDADLDFADLLKAAKEAGFEFSPVYGSEESDGATLQEYLKSIGHDSFIIKNIQGADKNPSMFRIFGVQADVFGTGNPIQVTDGSQIIVFDTTKETETETETKVVKETKVKIPRSGSVLVNKVKTLSEIEKWGESRGIPKSALTDFEIYNLINMHQKDGKGKQMPSFENLPMPKKTKELLAEKFGLEKNGRDWAITIDPYLVVQTMDDLNMEEDGKIYGANATVLSRIFRDVATEQELQTQVKEEQVSVHRPLRRNKKTLDRLNDIMHEALVSNNRLRKIMFDSKDLPNAAAIVKILKVSPNEAKVIEWHRDQLIKFRRGIALFENIRSDLSLIQKEERIKFTELERKVYEGIATEQEVYQYLSYAPEIEKGTDLKTADGKIVEQKRNIMRNAARWFFEKEAINSGNFYSFFDSIVSMGIKGDQYTDTIALIEEWATYLESIGQEDNAKWWRLRIDKNIKGNLFKFEDYILDIVSSVSERTFKGKNDKDLEFTGSGLDPLRNVDADTIKKNMVSALNIVQGAAIARSLGGNFAWSLITQPSSLAFTIMKTGFKKTFGAIYSIGFNAEPDRKSNVSRIKGFKKTNKGLFSAVEATGTWSDTGTKRGKRAVFRDKLGLIQSGIESWTTSVSYAAGYQYGLTMGLSEDQARIHGDFVAATTQTMYDQVTRNSALNSKFLRAMFPFQSYVFTAYSNALDIGGLIGTKRSAKQRWGIELVRWLVASKAWWWLWSYIFGDSIAKAIFNPTIDKATPGSFVPLFGKNIDIAVSKALPWMDDKEWQGDLPHTQFAKHTTKVLKNALEQDENWERELAIYFNTYVLPLGGVGGSVPVNNFIKTFDARVNDDYRYETAAGDTYRNMRRDSELVWINGVLFGVKGADEYTAFGKKQTLKKEKD